MIIACTKCQTRFKVPDGKVTARGLKVRCSRCGHTFRIFPDSAAVSGDPAPAALRPRGPDPFQIFGPEGTSDMEKTPARGTAVSALLAQMAPAPQGEDFDVDVAGVEAAGTEPAWNFPKAPSREVDADGVAPAAEPVAMPVRAVPSALAAPAAPEHSDPFDASPFPAGDLGASVAPPPPSPAVHPSLDTLAGFTPAWGVAAPVRALSVDGSVSSHASSLSAVVEPEAPPPTPQFGGAGTVLDDLPAPEPPAPPPADGVELDPGDATRAWTGAAPSGHLGMQLELEPDLAALELELGPLPGTALAPAADPEWALAPAASAPPPLPAEDPAPQWDDAFVAPAPAEPEMLAAPLPRLSAPDMSVILDEAPSPGSRVADHGLFEMPMNGSLSVPLASASLLPDVPDAQEAGSGPAPAFAFASPVPAISKPPSRARLGLQERELPGTARRVSAVVLNVGLAALLLLVVTGVATSWASAGRVEGAALSPRRLLQALRPGSGVSPVEVVPGTYETQSGRSLLYVRGRVVNRGAPAGRVRVRAEVWDGAQAVKSGETLAGAIATPEQLWRAATPADVEALRASLLSAATRVADGQQADFLVLLDEAPRDLSGLRLQIYASIER